MGRSGIAQSGFYTVHIEAEEGIKIPYAIFATSGDHAAKRVHEETGYIVSVTNIEGPFIRA